MAKFNITLLAKQGWFNIWSARELIEKGIGWRVGCGQSISLWNDVWSSFSGVVVRNHEGILMAAGAFINSDIADPCVAEANAYEQAMVLVKQMDFRKVILKEILLLRLQSRDYYDY